jgi:integration host factor subunit alpha
MVSVLTMGTLTRADLTESVYRNIGLSRNESSDLVEAVLEEICSCLEAGEEVKLSSFGTYHKPLDLYDKHQYLCKHPR